MIFVSRILHYGVSPISGINYTRGVLERMIEEVNSSGRKMFGVISQDMNTSTIGMNELFTIDLADVATEITNLELDDEGLVCYQNILDTPMGMVLQEMIEADVRFEVTPNMTGIVGDDKFATKLQLISVKFAPLASEPLNIGTTDSE